MATTPPFDLQEAHAWFAKRCFNAVWDLLDQASRTAEEEEAMVRLCQASIYHWTQRDDCQPKNLSVGYWQAARVSAVLERGEEALRYGELSLQWADGQPPFYRGYAHEALARAAALAGAVSSRDEHLAAARALAEQVDDAGSREALIADLDTIPQG